MDLHTATIWFNGSEFHVQEDAGVVEVCVESDGFGFTVTVAISDNGSAVGELCYNKCTVC